MNPFEIRLELIKLAKEMLEQDYFAKREVIRTNWEHELEKSRRTSTEAPAHPHYPPYPSEEEIIAKAQSLNRFISPIDLPPKANKISKCGD